MTWAVLLVCAALLSGASAWAQEDEATIALSSVAYRAGQLDAASPGASRAFAVDDADSLQFVVVCARTVDVEVVIPGGTVVTAGNAAVHGASWVPVTVDAIDEPPMPGFGIGEHVLVGFDAPPAGEYEIRLAASGPVVEPAPFLVTMILDSPVRMAAGVPDAEAITGRSIALAALLFEDDAPVPDAMLTAAVGPEVRLDGESPEIVSVSLRDDGRDADDAAGDGIYTGVFTPTVAGRYGFSVRAEGTASSGAAFLRHAGAGFRVSDPSATIEPPYGASGIDDDGNGRFEWLRFEAGARSDAGGHFVLGVVLRASNGRTVAASVATVSGAGGQRLAVDLTAAEVLSLGVDGPYAIDEIRLDELTAEDRWLRDRVRDAGSTGALRLAQFEGGPAACAGDCNADGSVTINELIRGVNIALGSAALGLCPACDGNGDGQVTINELIRAVNMALAGCPPLPPSPTPTAPATGTRTATVTAVPSSTTAASPTASKTYTATRPATATQSASVTATASPSRTVVPAMTPTGTPTPTSPGVATPTASPTAAPVEYCTNLDIHPIPDLEPLGVGVTLVIHPSGGHRRPVALPARPPGADGKQALALLAAIQRAEQTVLQPPH